MAIISKLGALVPLDNVNLSSYANAGELTCRPLVNRIVASMQSGFYGSTKERCTGIVTKEVSKIVGIVTMQFFEEQALKTVKLTLKKVMNPIKRTQGILISHSSGSDFLFNWITRARTLRPPHVPCYLERPSTLGTTKYIWGTSMLHKGQTKLVSSKNDFERES